MNLHPDMDKRLQQAIRHFWKIRHTQAQKQGTTTGTKDAGARTAVTGGAQMNGFVSLVHDLLCENGVPRVDIYCEKSVELPGWYRPEKK